MKKLLCLFLVASIVVNSGNCWPCNVLCWPFRKCDEAARNRGRAQAQQATNTEMPNDKKILRILSYGTVGSQKSMPSKELGPIEKEKAQTQPYAVPIKPVSPRQEAIANTSGMESDASSSSSDSEPEQLGSGIKLNELESSWMEVAASQSEDNK